MSKYALAILALLCIAAVPFVYGPGWQGGALALALLFLAFCVGTMAGSEEVDHLAARKRRIAARAAGERWGKR